MVLVVEGIAMATYKIYSRVEHSNMAYFVKGKRDPKRDAAVSNRGNRTGNPAKTSIRTIQKHMTDSS